MLRTQPLGWQVHCKQFFGVICSCSIWGDSNFKLRFLPIWFQKTTVPYNVLIPQTNGLFISSTRYTRLRVGGIGTVSAVFEEQWQFHSLMLLLMMSCCCILFLDSCSFRSRDSWFVIFSCSLDSFSDSCLTSSIGSRSFFSRCSCPSCNQTRNLWEIRLSWKRVCIKKDSLEIYV